MARISFIELAITTSELGGEPIFTAYLRDISKRKRGEAARQHQAAIVEASDDAIITLILTELSPVGTRAPSGSPVIRQKRSSVNRSPSDRRNEEPELLERIHRGEHVERYETVRQRKDGSLAKRFANRFAYQK